MTTCLEIRNCLNRMLDAGEVNPPDFVADHLNRCPNCRRWWEQMRQVEGALRETEATSAPPAPNSLYSRIRSALDQEPAPSRSVGRSRVARLSWAAVAATVIVIVGVSILVNSPRSTLPGPADRVTMKPNTSSLSALPPLPSLEALVAVPKPVIEARQDFSWLTNAVVSNARSAARAVAASQGETPIPCPTKTPKGAIES